VSSGHARGHSATEVDVVRSLLEFVGKSDLEKGSESAAVQEDAPVGEAIVKLERGSSLDV